VLVKARRPKKGDKAPFVKVPLAWVEELKKAKSTATHVVAYDVLYKWWKDPGVPVVVSNVAFPSLSPRQKLRAVAELEALGLVKVTRQGKQSPRLTPKGRV
jgi:hypothetical protein